MSAQGMMCYNLPWSKLTKRSQTQRLTDIVTNMPYSRMTRRSPIELIDLNFDEATLRMDMDVRIKVIFDVLKAPTRSGAK